MPPASSTPLLQDHGRHWVPAEFSDRTFLLSKRGIAAVATEQDPILQLFAKLETSFSSSNPQGTGAV